jgi:hypothetical protein
MRLWMTLPGHYIAKLYAMSLIKSISLGLLYGPLNREKDSLAGAYGA